MTSKESPTNAPKPDHPEAAVTPPAPPVVEYPKMLYHADGRQLTVQNADEEAKAKAEGFEDTPGGAAKEPRGKRA